MPLHAFTPMPLHTLMSVLWCSNSTATSELFCFKTGFATWSWLNLNYSAWGKKMKKQTNSKLKELGALNDSNMEKPLI